MAKVSLAEIMDGGLWKIRAMDSIKEYLTEALKEYPNFIIIS